MSELSIQQQIITALRDTEQGPLGPHKVRLIETHISWVLLAGSFAYKIKKAVDLEFLDFSTLAARRFYCEEELRINRRLAPQLYLDVIAIGGSPDHPVLGAEPAMEYAVRMRRFAADQLLDKLLGKGLVTPAHIDRLASRLAAFHGALPPAAPGTAYGMAAAIRDAAIQNFDQMAGLLSDTADLAALDTVRQLSEAEYARRERDFIARRAAGHVRECHGDLHLGNVALIRGEPVPFDGIEFSAELRWGDVMSETAFLTMDLLRHGRPALAFRFLNAYLEAGGDYTGISTLRYYLAYRAMVRAKIGVIRLSQPGLSRRAQAGERSRWHEYLALARRCLALRQPALIITHGLPGSGKTTFSQRALERLGAIRVRSDVERKRLFGLGPLDDSSTGMDIYGKQATQRTYGRLHELARIALEAGFPVIVDAAFLRKDERAHFRQLAAELQIPFAIASLHAPTEVLRSRLAQRQARANDASEADAGVLAMLQAAQQPLDAGEREHAVAFQASGDDAGDAPAWNRLAEHLSPPA